jgi:hypothetical protein
MNKLAYLWYIYIGGAGNMAAILLKSLYLKNYSLKVHVTDMYFI